MKKFAASLAACALAMATFCQTESTAFEKEVNFGTGLGLSFFTKFGKLVEIGADGAVSDTRSSLAHSGYLEYRPRHFFSFGIAGGTQYLEQTVQDFTFDVDDKTYYVESFDYKINRSNIGVYAAVHYLKGTKVDLYTTVRMGVSIFSIRLDINDEILLNELEKRATFAFTTPAFQATLLGMRYYPLKNIGLHCELGLGAPAYLTAGLSGRIPTGTVTPKTTSHKHFE
jgi:hypothetical protein